VCGHSRTHSLCTVRVRRGRTTSSGHSAHLHDIALAHVHRHTRTHSAHSTAVACAPPQHRTSPVFAAASHETSKRRNSGASERPPSPAHTAPPTPSLLAARCAPNGATGAAAPAAAATAAARGVRLHLVLNFLPAQVAGSGKVWGAGRDRGSTSRDLKGGWEGGGMEGEGGQHCSPSGRATPPAYRAIRPVKGRKFGGPPPLRVGARGVKAER